MGLSEEWMFSFKLNELESIAKKTFKYKGTIHTREKNTKDD